MSRQNNRSTGSLSRRFAVIVLFTSVAGNALAADYKACSHQARPNETLSEKLDQTGGVYLPA
jgi:hypothetical protein